MEVKATYEELSEYIQGRFNQPVTLGSAEGDLKVTYKTSLLKGTVHVVEVTEDSVLLTYKMPLGLHAIVNPILGKLTSFVPEGITVEAGQRIRVDLSQIEKAKPVVENIALREIRFEEDSIRIGFSLKTPVK